MKLKRILPILFVVLLLTCMFSVTVDLYFTRSQISVIISN